MKRLALIVVFVLLASQAWAGMPVPSTMFGPGKGPHELRDTKAGVMGTYATGQDCQTAMLAAIKSTYPSPAPLAAFYRFVCAPVRESLLGTQTPASCSLAAYIRSYHDSKRAGEQLRERFQDDLRAWDRELVRSRQYLR